MRIALLFHVVTVMNQRDELATMWQCFLSLELFTVLGNMTISTTFRVGIFQRITGLGKMTSYHCNKSILGEKRK